MLESPWAGEGNVAAAPTAVGKCLRGGRARKAGKVFSRHWEDPRQ